jgi:hypothetical protein
MSAKKNWYWVGTFGTGTARSGVQGPIPFPSDEPPGAYPAPDQWLGFATFEEARDAAQLMLKGAQARLETYMAETFPALLKKGLVAYRRPGKEGA